MASPPRRGSLTAEGPAFPSQRRASVPQGGSSVLPNPARRGSRPTFLGAGRRVSMLLKYKQAFQGRAKKTVPEEEVETNPMAPIRELPQSPRFSTFLSAEAQFAMMKGYEDKLYERISDSNPEVRCSLQRTKTPFQKISIVDQNKHLEEEEEEEDRESPEAKSTSSATSSGYSTLPASTRTLTVSTSSSDVTKPLDNRSLSPESPTSTTTTTTTTTISVPYLKPLRRQSVAGTPSTDINGNGMMDMWDLDTSLETMHLQRSHSLPTLDPPGGLSLNKRLVLTYRLESAMDLLDSLKEHDVENSLSPRVGRRQSQQGDVVRDFNSWTKVWNKEFKEIQSK